MRGTRAAAVGIVLVMAVTGCGNDSQAGTKKTPTSTTGEPPFSGRTLADGELAEVDSLDGATLQSVEDGVVRSYETSVEILEAGTADQLSDLRAGEGATLLVFTMETTRNERDSTLAVDAGEVTAAVVVDGTQRELPNWDTGGTREYAVAVPDDRRTVELRLKYGRFTQTFDLLEAEPTGDRPEALYRAEDATVVDAGDLTPASFEVNAYGAGFETYTVTAAAELGYLTYAGVEPPSADDKAWLTVTAAEEVSGAGSCSATIDAYALTDSDGARYEPVPSASTIAEPGILDGVVSTVTFEVPADLTSATLTVAPATVPCQVSTATFRPVPARGQATIEITLPAG
jgi:hypothetical protein